MLDKLWAPIRFLYDLIVRFIEDDGLALAGYLAYVGIMSLLPFLVFLFTLLGVIGQRDQGAGILEFLFRTVPDDVAVTLYEPLLQVIDRAGADVLTLSVVVVLWISASGIEGLRTALNRAYRVRETRRYWRRRVQSVGLVLLFSVFVVVAFAFLVAGPLLWTHAQDLIGMSFGFGAETFPLALRYGIGGASLFVVAAALYRTLPNRLPAWIGVLPGSAFVCGLVAGATQVYSFYIARFSQYAEIYGSLGGVISTMIFFYALGVIFILGAELNATLAEKYEMLKEEADEA